MSRSISRSMLRSQYTKFCEAWKNEKTYQKYLVENGDKLAEGTELLGRKPTFNMWMTAKKNQESTIVDEKKVTVEDTNWEE